MIGADPGADVEFSDDNLEVRIVVRLKGDVTPTGRILDVTHNVLSSVLTALGTPRVERTLEIWHETRAAEARESEEF